ncbi:MAG TPA: ACT domain-containing protein [Deltaproteobacteria bacterium]|nr:ACT domain-containing protein [Candidatus Binatota bacterium]HIL13808.1 ACT domain-containing protein [Deltaproteobacteria bacterium]
MAVNPAVISVLGRDQKGVVARVSAYLAERQVNIENIEQTVMEGMFIMTMLVDLADLSGSLDSLVLDLKRVGEELDMEVSVRLHGERSRKKIAILVSREPHCLQAIAAAHRSGDLDADISLVLSNHQDLEPLAQQYQLPFRYFPSTDKEAHMKFLGDQLGAVDPDLVVLARYMQVVPPDLVGRYRNKMVNIHPSLLPYYPGAKAYRQAWEAGVRVCGCTAHFVTEDLDQGPIILQDVFHINVGQDGLEDVRRRGQELEARTLTRAVSLFVNDELVASESKVLFRPGRVD